MEILLSKKPENHENRETVFVGLRFVFLNLSSDYWLFDCDPVFAEEVPLFRLSAGLASSEEVGVEDDGVELSAIEDEAGGSEEGSLLGVLEGSVLGVVDSSELG